MIIDGTNLILGRMASFVAKKALLGENIVIINCEKIVITGKKDFLLENYKNKYNKGTHKGPYFHRSPEKITRRAIRGMLPFKQEKGRKAFKIIKCYVGVPNEFKDKKTETLTFASVSKLKSLNYMYMGAISKFLGGKI